MGSSGRGLRVLLAFALLAGGCRNTNPKADAIRQGDGFLSAQQYRRAAQAYQAALAVDPADDSVRTKLGEALAGAGDSIRAADLLSRDLDVQLSAAADMLSRGRFEDVAGRMDAVLRANPESVPALVLHANAVARLRDSGGALSTLADKVGRARRFGPARVDLRSGVTSRDDARAESELRRAVTLAPSAFEPSLALANFFWATNRLEESEPFLRAAADQQHGHAAANHALGAYFLSVGRESDAATYLANAAAVPGASGQRARLTLVDFYIASHRPEDARALLDTMPKQEDAEGEMSIRLAALDAAEGDTAAAVRRLDRVLTDHPSKVSALLLKARLLFARGNADPRFARMAVDADPGESDARMLLGEVLAESGDAEGALDQYREAVRRDPTEVAPRVAFIRALLKRGTAEQAVQLARDVVRLAPNSKDAVLALVSAYLSANSVGAAATALAPILAQHPSAPDVAVAEGRVLAARGMDAAARSAFRRALAAAPDSLDALAALVALETKGRPAPDTVHRVETALAARPGNAGVLMLAAPMFLALGSSDRAEELLRQAFLVAPSNVEVALSLARLRRGNGQLSAAAAVLEQALRRRPAQLVDLRVALAEVYEAQGRKSEAQAQYEQVVLDAPDAPEPSYRLAMIYVENPERLSVALELAMTAKRGRPSDPDVDLLLGRIYTQKGLGGLAVPALQRAVAARPGHALSHLFLAAAYERGGNLSQARDEYAAALRIDPSVPGADKARQMASSRR